MLPYGLETAMQQTLGQYLQTGNIIWDTLIKFAVVSLMGLAVASMATLGHNAERAFMKTKELIFYAIGYQLHSIKLDGMVTRTAEKRTLRFSPKFRAALHHITNLPLNKSHIKEIREMELDSEKKAYFVDQMVNQPLVAEDVYADFRIFDKKIGDSYARDSYTEETWTITIYSRRKRLEELKELIHAWEESYSGVVDQNIITLNGKTSRDLSSSYGDSTKWQFSDRFFAVLAKCICTSGSTVTNLFELDLKEPGTSSDRYGHRDSDTKKETPDYMKNQLSRLVPKQSKLKGDINIGLEVDEETLDRRITITKYTLTISSKTKTCHQMAATIDAWEKEYMDLKFSISGLKYYVFSPSKTIQDEFTRSSNNYHLEEIFKEYPFDSSKTFENVFFADKDCVMDRIEFFQGNRSWYEKRGVPYTLTFLFHGEPGCGKTSTIKAIANMTQRHIVSISLKNVKTIEDLYKVFYGSEINRRPIPIHKRLFILEDIDCSTLKDTVKKRKAEDDPISSSEEEETAEEENGKNSDGSGVLVNGEEEERSQSDKSRTGKKKRKGKKQDKDKHTLTLADLLEVLDGVMEMKGRMIVMTTNHPEKLDPALIRPGRVDAKIEFGKCRQTDIVNLINLFYGDQIPGYEVENAKSKIPGQVWTPAEIVQILLNNIKGPRKALDIICKASKTWNQIWM